DGRGRGAHGRRRGTVAGGGTAGGGAARSCGGGGEAAGGGHGGQADPGDDEFGVSHGSLLAEVGQAAVVPLSTTRTGQRAWRVQRYRRRRVRHASHRSARASTSGPPWSAQAYFLLSGTS